jgi:hypothetical protein
MGIVLDFDCELNTGINQMHDMKQKQNVFDGIFKTLETQKQSVDGASQKLKIELGQQYRYEMLNNEICQTHIDFPQILDMLLGSIRSKYVEGIPLHKCSSPIPPNGNSYVPVFYVSKDPKLQKQESPDEGIPVRYQGFSKAIIWYSPENPRYGVVARRMQHQARMKQKNAKSIEDFAALSSAFFNYFEGFSYVLIDRGNKVGDIDKRDVHKYVSDAAAKLVQIWPTAVAMNTEAHMKTKINVQTSSQQRVKRALSSSNTTIEDFDYQQPKRQHVLDDFSISFNQQHHLSDGTECTYENQPTYANNYSYGEEVVQYENNYPQFDEELSFFDDFCLDFPLDSF